MQVYVYTCPNAARRSCNFLRDSVCPASIYLGMQARNLLKQARAQCPPPNSCPGRHPPSYRLGRPPFRRLAPKSLPSLEHVQRPFEGGKHRPRKAQRVANATVRCVAIVALAAPGCVPKLSGALRTQAGGLRLRCASLRACVRACVRACACARAYEICGRRVGGNWIALVPNAKAALLLWRHRNVH
jgi:hypothetical protein